MVVSMVRRWMVVGALLFSMACEDGPMLAGDGGLGGADAAAGGGMHDGGFPVGDGGSMPMGDGGVEQSPCVENEDDDWPEAWAEFECRVLQLTNERRAAGANCGGQSFGPAPPLEMNPLVRTAARLHSLDMAEQNYFSHTSLDGRTFDQRMSATGFSGRSPWGENIAAGQRTPEEVVDGWMRSVGHCRNIMDPSYRVIGIGYAEAPRSTFRIYWTQNFAAGH